MKNTPPLLPSETLRRVLRTARLDGTVVLAMAGTFALASASTHDVIGTAIGVAVAAAGAMELHGAGLVRHGDERGLPWLTASQLYLMALVLGYACFRINHPPIADLKSGLRSVYTAEQMAQLRSTARQAGLGTDDALRLVNSVAWGVVGVLTVLYQGGMMIYYRRRRGAVAAALHGGDPDPV